MSLPPLSLRALLVAATLLATTTTQTTAQIRVGDVSHDGQLSVLDALLVLSHVVGKPLPEGAVLAHGDADCDERLTARDALLVLSRIVLKPLPAGVCVGRPVVSGWDFEPDTLDLTVGQTSTVVGTPLDPKGFRWSLRVIYDVDGTSVVSVDTLGAVTAVGVGEAYVRAIAYEGTVPLASGVVLARVHGAPHTFSVSVEPAVDTVVVAGTVTFVATVRDGDGAVVEGAAVSWRSLDTLVAKVNGGVVTGRAPGSTSIIAGFQDVADSARVVVLGAAGVTKTWVGRSTAWNDTLNWSPVGVPTSTDTIFVPASVAHMPRLTTDRVVAAYLQAPGASTDVSSWQLEVTRYIAAGAVFHGTGWVKIGSDPRGFGGSFPNVRVSGSTKLNARSSASGTVEVTGALDMSGRRLSVGGSFRTVSSGLLVMKADADTLEVGGDTFFAGGSTVGSLTAGVLVARGPFRTALCDSFRPSGTHTTVFAGSVAQSTNVLCSHTPSFHNLTVDSSAVLGPLNDFTVTGVVRVIGEVHGAGRTVRMSKGTLVDDPVSPGWDVSTTIFLAQPQSFTPRFLRDVVLTDSAFTATNDFRVGGELRLEGTASLTLAGHHVTVADDFRSTISSRLVMKTEGDTLEVLGETFFAGGSTVGSLTAGVILARGPFRATSHCDSFRPSGTHTTIFAGSVEKSTNMLCSHTPSFHNLTIDSDAVVVPLNDFTVTGVVRVIGRVQGAGRTVRMSRATLVDHSETPGWGVATTIFLAQPQSFTARFLHDVVLTDSAFTATNDFRVGGELRLEGFASLTLAGHHVTVADDFRSNSSSRLVMKNDGDTLEVLGETVFSGGSTVGSLTAGTLLARGPFRTTSHCDTFRPSGTHTTVFAGSVAQSTNMWCALTPSFHHITVNPSADVTLSSLTISSSLVIFGTTRVGSGGRVDVMGHLDIRAGGTLANSGKVGYGSFSNAGTVTGNAPIPRSQLER